MARAANPWALTLSGALSLLVVDDLQRLLDWLSAPKPRPTRRADMIERSGVGSPASGCGACGTGS